MSPYFDFSRVGTTYTYEEFKAMMASLVEKGMTTGPDQSADKIELTWLNHQRIQRIEKRCSIREDVTECLRNFDQPQQWYLLIEAWCGDGSENLPVIANMAALAPRVELKILLRDEHPEIMAQYLTNGSRSIPKLIAVDGLSGKALWTWGPRPNPIQEQVLSLKQEKPDLPNSELKKQLHKWYAKDKCQSLQSDFEKLVLSG